MDRSADLWSVDRSVDPRSVDRSADPGRVDRITNPSVGKLVAAHGYRQKRENKLEIKK